MSRLVLRCPLCGFYSSPEHITKFQEKMQEYGQNRIHGLNQNTIKPDGLGKGRCHFSYVGITAAQCFQINEFWKPFLKALLLYYQQNRETL